MTAGEPLGAALLFVPAHDPKKLTRALDLGADAVILDLEDSVAPAEKPRARNAVREFLASGDPRAAACLVRVNALASPHLLADLHALAGLAPRGIVIPKVEAPDVVGVVGALLAPDGGIDLYALIETASGVARVDAIARAAGGLRGLMFGHADLANDLGVSVRRPLAGALGHARAATAAAARGAGLVAYDTPYEQFRDTDGLRSEAREALDLAYAGKLAIHPVQVPVIQAVWRPSAEEVERAKRVLEAFEVARAAGAAVAVLDGGMIERQMAESARRVLARAGSSRP